MFIGVYDLFPDFAGKAGKYEIFIYRTYIGIGDYGGEYLTNYPGMKNYYTVYTPEGKKEIILEVGKDDPVWVSLGIFSLPAGESCVVLDDRGVSPIKDKYAMKRIQIVMADAVKWVKIK